MGYDLEKRKGSCLYGEIIIIKKLKELYDNNINIINYLKEIDGQNVNTIEDIMISYEFQAGSYIKEYQLNLQWKMIS